MFIKIDKLYKAAIMVSLVAALVLIICISKFGVGLSNDSVAYIVAAKSFYAERRIFLSDRDSYFTNWPRYSVFFYRILFYLI